MPRRRCGLRLRRRRLRRRRRHASRRGWPKRACAWCCSRRRRSARRLPSLPDDYDVPAFHPLRVGEPGDALGFLRAPLRRRGAAARAIRKRQPDGIFYPRAGTLGGCTAHNAMIFVRAARLRLGRHRGADRRRVVARGRHAALFPAPRELPASAGLARCWRGLASTRPGMAGAAGCRPSVRCRGEAFGDDELVRLVLRSAHRRAARLHAAAARALRRCLRGAADPNDWRWSRRGADGLCYTPLIDRRHRRMGARERLLDVAARHPDRLRIELDALATRVLFDDDNRAIGVEYLKGERLYRAHPGAGDGGRRAAQVRARARGDPRRRRLQHAAAPDAVRHRPARRARARTASRCASICRASAATCRTATRSASSTAWRGPGACSTAPTSRAAIRCTANGRAAGRACTSRTARRSRSSRRSRAGAARRPTSSAWRCWRGSRATSRAIRAQIAEHHDYLTWAILKAHTSNRAGARDAALGRSARPAAGQFPLFRRRRRHSRRRSAGRRDGIALRAPDDRGCGETELIAEEELPGRAVQTDEKLADFVRDNAWGHHASCTCAIGPRDGGGVLDSRLRGARHERSARRRCLGVPAHSRASSSSAPST